MLNMPGFQTTAAIVAEVEDTSRWRRGRNARGRKPTGAWDATPDASMHIANCDRRIEFNCEISDPGERENMLFKLDTMIDTLQSFRDGYVIEVERYLARLRAAGIQEDD